MLLLPGPRQVGKTTLSKMALDAWPDKGLYLNWDITDHRKQILSDQDLLAEWRRPTKKPMLIFDELHKMRRFKGNVRWFINFICHCCQCIFIYLYIGKEVVTLYTISA
jgi:predicted AAA+ superfamily ATPase